MAGVTAAVAGGLLAAGGTVYGAVKGAETAKKTRTSQERMFEEAQAKREEAAKLFDQLEVPSLQDRLYKLERYKQVGTLSPRMEEAITQEQSRLLDIMIDPRFREEQMEVLNELDRISEAEGLTPEDRAKLEQIKSDTRKVLKSNRERILQAAMERGALTGGQVVGAQLQAQQEAAEVASQEGFNVAAEAYKRALDALAKKSELATGLRAQEFGEETEKAKAQDIIEQFNVQQRSEAQRRNIERENLAQMRESEERQRIADLNVALGQEEARRGAEAKEQRYRDLLDQTRMQAGVRTGQAQAAETRARETRPQPSAAQAVGQTAGKIGSRVLDYGLKQIDFGPRRQVTPDTTPVETEEEKRRKRILTPPYPTA